MNIHSERTTVIELLNQSRNSEQFPVDSDQYWNNLKEIEQRIIQFPELIDQGFVGQFVRLCEKDSPLSVKNFFVEFLDHVLDICELKHFQNEKTNILKTSVSSLTKRLTSLSIAQLNRDEEKTYLNLRLIRKRIQFFTRIYPPCLNYICFSSSDETEFWNSVKRIKNKIFSMISHSSFSIRCLSVRFISEAIICCFSHDERSERVFIHRKGESKWCWIKPPISFFDFHLGKLPERFHKISSSPLKEFSRPDFDAEGKMLLNILSGKLIQRRGFQLGNTTVVLQSLLNIAKRRAKCGISVLSSFIKFDDFLIEVEQEGKLIDEENELKSVKIQMKYILIYCFEIPSLSLPFFGRLAEKLNERYNVRGEYLENMKRALSRAHPPQFELQKRKRKRQYEQPQQPQQPQQIQPPPQQQAEETSKRVKLQMINTPIGQRTPIELADIVLKNILNLRTASAPPNTPPPTQERMKSLIMNMFRNFRPDQFGLIDNFVSVRMDNSSALEQEQEQKGSSEEEKRKLANEEIMRKKIEEERNLKKKKLGGDSRRMRDEDEDEEEEEVTKHLPTLNNTFQVTQKKLDSSGSSELYQLMWEGFLQTSLTGEGTVSLHQSLVSQHVLSFPIEGDDDDGEDTRNFRHFISFFTKTPQNFMKYFDLLLQVLFSEFLHRRSEYDDLFMGLLSYVLQTSFFLIEDETAAADDFTNPALSPSKKSKKSLGSDQKGVLLRRLYLESPHLPEKSLPYLDMLVVQKGFTMIGLNVLVNIWFKKKKWGDRCLKVLLDQCCSDLEYVRQAVLPQVSKEIYCYHSKSLSSSEEEEKEKEKEEQEEQEEEEKKKIEKKIEYSSYEKSVRKQIEEFGQKKFKLIQSKKHPTRTKEKMKDEEETEETEGEEEEEDDKKMKDEEEEEEELEYEDWTINTVEQFANLYYYLVTRNSSLFLDYLMIVQETLEESFHPAKQKIFETQLSRLIIRIGMNSDTMYKSLKLLISLCESQLVDTNNEINQRLLVHVLVKTITSRSQMPESRFMIIFRKFVYERFLKFEDNGILVLHHLTGYLSKSDIFKSTRFFSDDNNNEIAIFDGDEDDENKVMMMGIIKKVKVAPIWFFLLLQNGNERIERFVENLLKRETEKKTMDDASNLLLASTNALAGPKITLGGIQIQILDDGTGKKTSIPNMPGMEDLSKKEEEEKEKMIDEDEEEEEGEKILEEIVSSEDLLIDINRFSLEMERVYENHNLLIKTEEELESVKKEKKYLDDQLDGLVRNILKTQNFSSSEIKQVMEKVITSDYFIQEKRIPQTFFLIVFYSAMVYLDLRSYTVQNILRKLLGLDYVWKSPELFKGLLACYTKNVLWGEAVKVLVEECSPERIEKVREGVAGMKEGFRSCLADSIRETKNYQSRKWKKFNEEKLKYLKTFLIKPKIEND